MKDFPRGSAWSKWDLHVHTPDSIVQHYGDGDDVWKRYINALEKLPSDIKVLGINDYYFIDGYTRLKHEKNNGRLSNIELLLPVVEFRLESFAGVEFKNLKRINFHVIFSDELEPSTIKSQFLDSLQQSYLLTGGNPWLRAVTRGAIEELGKQIKESVPPEELSNYGSDLEEGFNNLNLKLDDILGLLKRDCFKDKYLTAIGKTEWASLKWSDSSIATKKTVINRANIVFTAAESPDACRKAKKTLTDQRVNDLLLDCSDAHSFADSEDKDKLGNCFTWIKADTTFRGLQMALKEPVGRIYIGDVPPELEKVRLNPTKYISKVSFSRHDASHANEHWFSGDVPINTGLVAVIGNKGSGKSALADTIGLLGNSKNEESFSFLNHDRFRKLGQARYSLAGLFDAELHWESQESIKKNLNEAKSPEAVERVKYLPQEYIEKICVQLASDEDFAFEKELKAVIFTHVSQSERLGQPNLDELIKFSSSEKHSRIDSLLKELKTLSRDRAALEAKADPNNKKVLQEQIRLREQEIEAHRKLEPKPVVNPSETENPQVDAVVLAEVSRLEKAIEQLDESAKKTRESLERAKLEHAVANRLIEKLNNFDKDYQTFLASIQSDATSLGITSGSLIEVKITLKEVEEKSNAARDKSFELEKLLDDKNTDSSVFQAKVLKQQLEGMKAKLDAPNRAYQAYLKEKKDWDVKLRELKGNKEASESLEGLKALLAAFDELPNQIGGVREKQVETAGLIHAQKVAIQAIYQDLYRPVQDFIDNHEIAKPALNLEFRSELENYGFARKLMGYINNNRKGTYYGADDGLKQAKSYIAPIDLEDVESVKKFLLQVDDSLHSDLRDPSRKPVLLSSQLLQDHEAGDVYNFLYGLDYIRPRYVLRWDEKELAMLSPGERGTLLLVFYLLIDKGDMPLIIDQPEGNLDNHTVFKVLVDCIKEARKYRQVIIVTHNPNLAVVCDADQVIYAKMDKEDGNRITYSSGSLENPRTSKHVTDVLEGTLKAFGVREAKYGVGYEKNIYSEDA